MKDIVIGTAGHIDHGKTTLVKYLTGKDTDTLPEEKKRGITIDLGFSFLELPENKKIGIVDVPGHEKFIKNMTAGVSGIDYIILTVAADDGVMPQTEEHFNIIKLLGVKHGVIVLTKCDLASPEQKEKAKENIKNLVENSFLENSEILEVSKKNLVSYENLKNYIIKDIEKIQKSENFSENYNKKDFKMYVDKVFSVKGFGTVVTGTVLSGEVSINDFLYVYPKNIKVKVKGIENHSVKVEKINAGRRCALNLSGIEKDEIKRGGIISSSDNFPSSKIVHVMFEPLKNFDIKNSEKVKIYIGTKEIKGKIRILEKNSLENSKKYPAEFLLDEEITAEFGELGIIRSLNPPQTIGGFKVLSLSQKKADKKDREYIKNLISLDKNIKIQENINGRLIEIICNFHKNFPLKRGILSAQLKNQYFSDLKNREFRNLIDENIKNGNLKCEKIFEKEYISIKDFKIKLNKDEKNLKEQIFKIYKGNAFNLQKKSEIKKIFPDKNFDEIHNYLAEEGMIIFLGEDFYILKGFLKEAEKKIKEFILENEKITISQARKILNVKRAAALMILEKLDELKITKRINDYRILEKETSYD
ncbi:MAG: selenocysteine-specific translation elongation factor [Fusobacterium sp.]|nr:selenocysteine-specific translation elongation factor [Fusobacterium sp.]